jgi:fusaric acid resistance family protein
LLACVDASRRCELRVRRCCSDSGCGSRCLLRNFASYAASLAGYTAAIIAGDLLGTVGGVDANAAFLLAVTRATEICLGIVCARIVLAATDLGGARRRLASLFAELGAGITAGLARTLEMPAADFPDAQAVRRQFLHRVIGLDPIIDQALGESSEIRHYSPALQRAVDGLFSALAAWDVAANHLATLPRIDAQQEASIVLGSVPPEMRSPPEQGAIPGWLADPTVLRRMCQTAVARWTSVPGGTPSLQLLTDKTAEAFGGIGHVSDGIALLATDPARPVPRGGHSAPRVRLPRLWPRPMLRSHEP